MDTATPHCELLNTYNLNNHTGDELSFEKGIRTLWLKDCRREKAVAERESPEGSLEEN